MFWVLVAAQIADPTCAAAVEAAARARIPEAIPALEALSRQRPAEVDVWLDLGLAYLAAHRYDAADRALERALKLAPDYKDVRLAYARSAHFSGRTSVARERLAPLLASAGGDAEVGALRDQIEAKRREEEGVAWRLDVAHASSELSNGLGHWTSTLVSLSARRGRDTGVISAERTERFGQDDLYLEALGARAFDADHDAWIALGATAGHADHRPRVAVRAGGSVGLWSQPARAIRLGADASWAHYPVGDVRSVQPYATLAWGTRASVTARTILTVDETDEFRAGYAVRGDWTLHTNLRLSAGWADAPESSSGQTVTVRAASLAAAVDFSSALSLQLGFVHEMRDAYDRDEVALALTARF